LAVLLIALVPAGGSRGAATATALAELAAAGVGGLLACRRGGMARPDLGVLSKVGSAAVVAVVSALVISAPAVVRSVLACSIYAAVVLLTRALPQEVWAILPPGWRRSASSAGPT
jgi:hypothetical protein